MSSIMRNDWENPEVVGINREPMHVTSSSYPTLELAREGEASRSPWVQSLNGEWRFHWAPNPDEAPEAFYLPDDRRLRLGPDPCAGQLADARAMDTRSTSTCSTPFRR